MVRFVFARFFSSHGYFPAFLQQTSLNQFCQSFDIGFGLNTGEVPRKAKWHSQPPLAVHQEELKEEVIVLEDQEENL